MQMQQALHSKLEEKTLLQKSFRKQSAMKHWLHQSFFPQQDSLIEDECYSLSTIFHISANEVFKLFQAKIDYKELQAAQETDVQLQKYLNKQENTNLKLTKRNYYYKNDLL